MTKAEKSENNVLWLGNKEDIVKARIGLVDGEEVRTILDEYTTRFVPSIIKGKDYDLEAVRAIKKEKLAGLSKDAPIITDAGFLKPIGTKKSGLLDKRYLYAEYYSKHPVTSKIVNNMFGVVNQHEMPIRLRELIDEQSYSLIMSLPRKTPADYRRINKLVKLYLTDYEAFLNVLPLLTISEDKSYPIADLEQLSRLNDKYGFMHQESSILQMRKIGLENTQVLKLSYRLLDN